MAAVSDSPYEVTQYRARLETLRPPRRVVPVETIMLSEQRSGGWSGTVGVDPRLASAERAFQTLLSDGLVPGDVVLVKLVIAGDTRHTGTDVRIWPSIITSVSTERSGTDHSGRDAFCAITLRDPLSHLRNRAIWTAFAECSLGEILGGALSTAGGGDGKPTRSPVLPGMPVVRIAEQLREKIGKLPYAIAAGDPLGYWLNRVCGRLGVRIEMRGDTAGRFNIDLCDGEPSESDLNGDGGLVMTVDPRGEPSATNLTIGQPVVNPPFPTRGGLLDNPTIGGARRFGRPGAVESVIVAAGTEVEEAEKRAGFRRAGQNLSRVRMSVVSCQPGLLPGRVVKVSGEPDMDETAGQSRPYTSLFGAKEWQVADVSHLYVHARYWNHAELEKTGAAWRPAVPPEEGAKIVSAVVDDGESGIGELIERDRLGRIPLRFPFVVAPADTELTSSSGDIRWPPLVPLPPIEPIAGNLHGFVAAHRQGDWCRVAVVNPLYAEIVGSGYRDDRYLNASIRDATTGMVVRQGRQDWRGMLFRPDEELDREIDGPDVRDDDPGSQDDGGGQAS